MRSACAACRAACRTPGHGWPGRAIRSRSHRAREGIPNLIDEIRLRGMPRGVPNARPRMAGPGDPKPVASRQEGIPNLIDEIRLRGMPRGVPNARPRMAGPGDPKPVASRQGRHPQVANAGCARTVTAHAAARGKSPANPDTVIPAKAGTQARTVEGRVPSFQRKLESNLISRHLAAQRKSKWIPAFAGMTNQEACITGVVANIAAATRPALRAWSRPTPGRRQRHRPSPRDDGTRVPSFQRKLESTLIVHAAFATTSYPSQSPRPRCCIIAPCPTVTPIR